MLRVVNDKPYGYFRWFPDEQPDDEVKAYVEKQLSENKVDIILSHTCPFDFEPVDMFLSFVNQALVDDSTERWLQKIYDTYHFEKWYCGHFHVDRKVKNVEFKFKTIAIL